MKKITFYLMTLICMLMVGTKAMAEDTTVFSLTVTAGKTDNIASKSGFDVTSSMATIVGGSAYLYNGKSSEAALMDKSNVKLGGSSGSYLKITLTSETLKAGDKITFSTANTFKLASSTTISKEDVDYRQTGTTGEYTVTEKDFLSGITELYIFKSSGSSFNSVTITRPAPATPSYTTSVTLSKTTLELKDNETFTLTATADEGYNQGFTWTSSDTNVATVDADGKVTPVAVGNATITVKAKSGSGETDVVSADCAVTVTAHPKSSDVTVKSVTVGGVAVSAVEGVYSTSLSQSTTAAPVVVTPNDANATVQYSVDGGAASSSCSLNCSAAGTQTVTATVTAEDGTTTESYTIKVEVIAVEPAPNKADYEYWFTNEVSPATSQDASNAVLTLKGAYNAGAGSLAFKFSDETSETKYVKVRTGMLLEDGIKTGFALKVNDGYIVKDLIIYGVSNKDSENITIKNLYVDGGEAQAVNKDIKARNTTPAAIKLDGINAGNSIEFECTGYTQAQVVIGVNVTKIPSQDATISAGGYTTFCPVEADVIVPEGVTAYAATIDDDQTKVTLTKVAEAGEKLKQGEGFVLKGDAGQAYSFAPTKDAEAVADNQMKGQTTAGKLSNVFALGVSGTSCFFGPWNDAENDFTAGKAYLNVAPKAAAGAAKVEIVIDDETTAIAGVSAKAVKADGRAYNLAGQTVGDSFRGIVIKNGKKVIK